MRYAIAVFAACLMLSMSARAENTIPEGAVLHPQLQKEIDTGEVEIHYMGTAKGLNAWMMRKGDQVRYVYTTPDGQAYILGVLIDAEGKSITARQVKDFLDAKREGRDLPYQGETPPTAAAGTMIAPQPEKSAEQLLAEIDQANRAAEPPPLVEGFYQEIEKADWIGIGNPRAPYIYILVDPDCPDCHAYWEKMKTFVDDGLIQLRLIPVGLTKTSRKKSAALLAAESPEYLWRVMMGDETGQIPDIAEESPHIEAVNRNIALMYDWGFKGVPYTVYRDGGGMVKLIYDVPDNPMLVVSEVTFSN